MAFWNDLTRNVGNFFGDIGSGVSSFFGGNQKKKRDDQNQNFGSNSSSAPRSPFQQNSQNQSQLKVQQPKPMFDTGATALRLPGQTQNTPNTNFLFGNNNPVKPVVPQKSQTEQELDRLTQQNLADAKKQTQQGEGFFDKAVNFFTHDDDKIAQQNARNRAASQYQEQHGWNKNPDVMKFMGGTRDLGQQESNRIQGRIKTQNDIIKKSSSIPVVSDFAALGSAGAEGIYKMLGDKQAERDSHNNWTRATLGMDDEEVARLPQDQQDRLRKLQMGLSVASPVMSGLDIASLGTAGAAVSGLKAAGVQGGKQALITEGKQAARNVGRNALIAGASAPVVAAPIENYINNGNPVDFKGYDLGNVPREAGTAALWSVLLPGGSKKPAAEDINNTRTAAVRSATETAGETARLAEEGAGGTRIQVQQPREIGVTDASPEGVNISVTNNTREAKTRPIVEVSGDTPGVNKVTVPTAGERAAQQFNDQPQSRPDYSVEGINSPDRVITAADKAEAQATIDDALQTGKIDENQAKDLNDQLSQIKAHDEPAPKGKPISVQEIKSIPVQDQSVVPQNLPEVPGTVRATTSTAPSNAKSAEVAAKMPVALPAETQRVLDNPKQFNKRQVAAARNQAKLAKAKATADENTAAALDRIQTASPAAQSGEGFMPTGEFGKSVNGGTYQKVNRAAEMQQAVQETANMSPGDVIQTARANADQSGGGFNRRDIRNIAALFEQKRIPRGTPEYEMARQILKEDGTNWGQTGALRNYTIRRTASTDELVSRFESKIYRLAEDPSKIDSRLFDQIDAAESKFTDTRDAALQAYNRFTEAPTKANTKAYHTAQDAADAADREVKMIEYKVASKALKGNKDVQQARELEKMAQSADMYQMDSVDASMLSGTGTFVRNLVNAAVGSGEEKLFGKVAARIASKMPNARKNNIVVGGGTGTKGLGQGVKNIVDVSKARASEAGANPLEHIKNFATTGNQLGDALIDTQVTNNVRDHYTQLLKSQGFKGEELNNRASVMARQDPDGVTHDYQQVARVAAGLGSGITRNNKIETTVKNIISDGISGGKPNRVSETTAKLITRMTLGFPTAIGRSLAEGGKRFTLGAPTFIKAMRESDPQARALLVKEGVKQAGTGGLVIPPLFYALGASGAITGAYPSGNSAEAKAEQARWQREGITENSIKIGDNYYQLPSYLGSWALPGLFYASLGRNNGDFAGAAADTAKIVPSILPTDQMGNWQDVISGRSDPTKFFTQTAASAVRAATPGGALLNQLAKSFDPTQNDTNSGDAVSNFVDKVMNGIPGAANTLPDKTDDQGNVLKNPNPLAIAAGASSTVQQAGVEHTGELNTQANDTLQKMADMGAFNDPNIKAVITDEKTQRIYSDILAGKQASPEDVKKVQDAMVRGVSETGSDTAYLEKEQYDTNLTALNMKRSLMAADPTTKPSDLSKMDLAIKRGQVYKENKIPYDFIKQYEDTSLSEWRAMGNEKSDAYDPDTYNKLWAMDKLMTKAGASYKTDNPKKQKYAAKSAGSGRGGRRGSASTLSSDFGTLRAGTGAPNVQAYDTIDAQSGAVPIIQVQRPNIVHKIGFSG